VTAPSTAPAGGDPLAQRVADAVAAHPAVARLDGGAFGSVATHLPGRRLLGVRIGRGDEPVEIAVVLHGRRPIPDVVRVLRRRVAAVCAAAGHPVRAVDVTVSDLAVPPPGPDGT
jgi:plasmid stabilization system protein ParE